MSEPVKVATDSVIGSLGIIAFFIQGVTLLTALGGLILITLRVAISVQEWRINRLKLRTQLEISNEPGA